MPGHCCVPGCRGNYEGEKAVRVFTFPADADRRRQWLKAIPRADFVPGKRSVVCERHFRASDIRTYSSYVHSKTGKVVEAKLKIARLSPEAVPCVFPNCPAYLSAPATATSREAPDEKRMRLEAASLREAIAASLQTHEEEESGNNIDTFQTLLERVSEIKLSSFWNVSPQFWKHKATTSVNNTSYMRFLQRPSEKPPILTASFKTLRELHSKEQSQQIKSAPTLTTKALNPSNIERQNVMLALKIFNPSTAAALRTCGPRLQFEHVVGTAEFLEIIKWWSILNVKTCNKGIRLRDELQSPITSVTSPQVQFLLSVVKWLDLWQSLKFDTGILTRETHSALRLTTDTLVKVTKYCLEEMHFDYELLGKFQTDCLEERFGKYRQLAGAQYHISIRQVYESERKLRLQNILELPEMETATAAVAVNDDVLDKFDIDVADDDYQKKAPNLHATTYVAGYCAHAAFKKLSCMSCKGNLMLEDNIEVEDYVQELHKKVLELCAVYETFLKAFAQVEESVPPAFSTQADQTVTKGDLAKLASSDPEHRAEQLDTKVFQVGPFSPNLRPFFDRPRRRRR
ncbi:hypothetical protein HPB49_026654 [Dermacentor silvarum]|nr:hypothetical protein HPB49_026654 [Dermacentor silvarum]